ncbi:MAG: hypothetical protein KGZ85_16355 [Ignavibacterium sp.]|nr:hypothetical protein [Ignavibacterium sp.]
MNKNTISLKERNADRIGISEFIIEGIIEKRKIKKEIRNTFFNSEIGN